MIKYLIVLLISYFVAISSYADTTNTYKILTAQEVTNFVQSVVYGLKTEIKDISPNEIVIATGSTRIGGSTFGVAPFYTHDGIFHAGNVAWNLWLSVPSWATNAEWSAYFSSVDTNVWDIYTVANYLSRDGVGGRVQYFVGNTQQVAVLNTNWLTKINGTSKWPNTNTQKTMTIQMTAGTNSLNRYLNGPIQIKFVGPAIN